MPSEQTVEYPQNIPLAPKQISSKKGGVVCFIKVLDFVSAV